MVFTKNSLYTYKISFNLHKRIKNKKHKNAKKTRCGTAAKRLLSLCAFFPQRSMLKVFYKHSKNTLNTIFVETRWVGRIYLPCIVLYYTIMLMSKFL